MPPKKQVKRTPESSQMVTEEPAITVNLLPSRANLDISSSSEESDDVDFELYESEDEELSSDIERNYTRTKSKKKSHTRNRTTRTTTTAKRGKINENKDNEISNETDDAIETESEESDEEESWFEVEEEEEYNMIDSVVRFTQVPGVNKKYKLKDTSTAIDFFSVFFTSQVYQHLCLATNNYADWYFEKKGRPIDKKARNYS